MSSPFKGVSPARDTPISSWSRNVDFGPSNHSNALSGWGGMLSLRLETIRGSFPTEYSGILKGFWARYQWNYHENPYFVSKTHFPQKMNFDIGLVGNFEMHFFTKRHRFWRDLTLTFQTKQKSRKNIQYWKSYVRFLKTEKKGLFFRFCPGRAWQL